VTQGYPGKRFEVDILSVRNTVISVCKLASCRLHASEEVHVPFAIAAMSMLLKEDPCMNQSRKGNWAAFCAAAVFLSVLAWASTLAVMVTQPALAASRLPAVDAISQSPSSDSSGPIMAQPLEGQIVPMMIDVVGELVEPLAEGQYLVVAVRPLPQRNDQAWWIQSSPVFNDDRLRWQSSPTYIGRTSDGGLGYPFMVCSVITKFPFERGQQLVDVPAGPRSCVTVIRQ